MRVPRVPRWGRRQRRPGCWRSFLFGMRCGSFPGSFENLAGQVDGVIALDDQSTDGSRALVESQPLLVDLVTPPPGAPAGMEDGKRHSTLIKAAWDHKPDWLLGIDADERLERGFRHRAEREIASAEASGQAALWVPFRELWDSGERMRVDGIWGQKRKACLFEADRGHSFREQYLHSIWASWPPANGEYPVADLRLYHLRMIRAEDRQARSEHYQRVDPERQWQAVGYDYLVDEEGIELRRSSLDASTCRWRPKLSCQASLA